MEKAEDPDCSSQISTKNIEFLYNDSFFEASCSISKHWCDSTADVEYNGLTLHVTGATETGKRLVINIMNFPQCIIDSLLPRDSKPIMESVIEAFNQAYEEKQSKQQ